MNVAAGPARDGLRLAEVRAASAAFHAWYNYEL